MKEERERFKKDVKAALEKIGWDRLSYNKDEFWMMERPYAYIEYYATRKKLMNCSIALRLGRALHNSAHRKSGITKDGVFYRLPYYYHCLCVCRMLVDLQSPLSHEEEDILLAAALLHDTIEDVEFERGGLELTQEFGLDPRVYETVKLVSKRKDFTEEEHKAYFRHIEENPLALLIKLSDRSNNVEDLYNMSLWKTHEYVGETRSCFFPMVDYARANYHELLPSIEILYEKINALTQVTEILINRYEKKEVELMKQVEALTLENEALRKELGDL